MEFHVKRIYEPREPADGYRVLVDRLWPRGVSKDRAELDAWMKELTPKACRKKCASLYSFGLTAIPSLRSGPPPGRRWRRAAVAALILNPIVRCYTLKTISGSCRDYRATATCDFDMDTADKERKVEAPLLLLWGARGISPERSQEFLNVWQSYATNIVAAEGLQCGHYIPEEMPDRLIEHFEDFFTST